MLLDKIEFPDNAPLRLSVVQVEAYPFHIHSDVFEIIFVLEGDLELTVVNSVLPMATGDIYISSPNELHRLNAYADTPVLVLLIHINLAAYKAEFPEIDSYQFANTAVTKNNTGMKILGDFLKKQMPRLLDGSEAARAGYYEFGEKILKILIQEFQCYYLGKGYPEFNNVYQANELQLKRIRRVIDYIYKNYSNPIKIEDVAELEHISPYHLTYILKNGSGVGFRTFLNMARAEKSATFLLENEKSPQAIAYECGFSKYKYFSDSFERVFRTTPQQYRKTHCGHTIAVQDGRMTSLVGAELEAFLKKYCSRFEEISLDLHREYPLTPLDKPRCINLSGASYTHITDFPVLRACRGELTFDRLGVDVSFLRAYRHNPKMLGYILADFQALRLSLCVRLGPRDRLQDVKACLELLRGLRRDDGQVEFLLPPQREAHTTNAAMLRKLIETYGVLVSAAEGGPALQKNPIHASGYMPCFLLHTLAWRKGPYIDQIALLNEHGPRGSDGLSLMSAGGLKTPVYHLLYLLERMGTALIAQGDMYFITRTPGTEDFQILAYYYDECFDSLFQDVSEAAEHATFIDLMARDCESNREVTLHINHIAGNYALRRYQLTSEDYRSKYRETPPHTLDGLSDETLRVLNETLSPKLALNMLELNGSYDIEFKLNPFELILFAFEKI